MASIRVKQARSGAWLRQARGTNGKLSWAVAGDARPAGRRNATGLPSRALDLGLVAAATASLVALGAGCSGFPAPPKYAPVNQPVLVSADGRTVTSLGQFVCGRRPMLMASPTRRKVTLTWLNPDTSCGAEPIGLVAAHAILRAPLGSRALLQASTRTAIPYFSERDLARVTILPPGFRLTSDLPSAQWVCANFVGSKISLPGWRGQRPASGCGAAARSRPSGRWLPGSAGWRCCPRRELTSACLTISAAAR